LKVDYEPPTVRVSGVRDGAVYDEKPKPKCEAFDGSGKSDSGVRRCELDVVRLKPGKFTAIAVAKDRVVGGQGTRGLPGPLSEVLGIAQGCCCSK